jgi:hypothetical protein
MSYHLSIMSRLNTTHEYKTIQSIKAETFDKTISYLLNIGWQLYEAPYEMDGTFCQALIKETQNKGKTK